MILTQLLSAYAPHELALQLAPLIVRLTGSVASTNSGGLPQASMSIFPIGISLLRNADDLIFSFFLFCFFVFTSDGGRSDGLQPSPTLSRLAPIMGLAGEAIIAVLLLVRPALGVSHG